MSEPEREYQHPLVIRITHAVNVVALGLMVSSGLRIYNASPIWDFEFPAEVTLGGWLAGARMWHFFAMWLFVLNGIVWVFFNVASRHGRKTTLFRKSDASGVLPMIRYYLRLQKERPLSGKYNALQKLAYTVIPLAAAGSLFSGISLYWPVQFSSIASIFGGYDTARVWHFVFTTILVMFFVGHLCLVFFSGWSNLFAIVTGWKRIRKKLPT
ncbi:MAG: cytochrome b/b6 domain-containing protein [Bacteroidota bacterium]